MSIFSNATRISSNLDWIDDVCLSVFHLVAYSNTTLYAVGGVTVLRSPDDPNAPLVQNLANSHLYTLSLTGSNTIDLSSTSGLSTLFHPSPERLPDHIPRVIWGNCYQRQGRLYFFGGVRPPLPVYLPNGTASLADPPDPGTQLFTYDISSATWLSDKLQSGTGAALAQAATAYDLGREVLWMYGGATFNVPFNWGDLSLSEPKQLWKAPGHAGSDPDCVVNSTVSGDSQVGACQVNTTTVVTPSANGRPTLQATMVFINLDTSASSGSPGSAGILVLFGGQASGIQSDMKDIHVYDIATRIWYTQKATASNDTFPPDRLEACAVVASAPDNSSHNIYVFGGYSLTGSVTLGEVWILTLPTFHWVRTGSGVDRGRTAHSCTKFRGTYMLVYKGKTELNSVSHCDNNAGVQVMDLTTLEWISKIGPGGGDQGDQGYRVPEMVYSLIGGSLSGGALFTSPVSGFVTEALYSVFQVPRNQSLLLNQTLTQSSEPSAGSSGSLASGAIAGIVIGAVVGLITALVFALYKIRRHRMHKNLPSMTQVAAPTQELDSWAKPREELPDSSVNPTELWANEPAAVELSELHGQSSRISPDHTLKYSPAG